MTTAASLSARTWWHSSAVNRYGRGTATRPSLRQACMNTTTWVLFGPHHTPTSPARTPSAAKPLATRLISAFISARLVTAPSSMTAGNVPSAAAQAATGSARASGTRRMVIAEPAGTGSPGVRVGTAVWIMPSGADTLVLMIGDLVERIEVHRRWQASLGAEGERLSLTGENLRGVDLSVPEQLGAELYNANLDGATPARTVLGNAYLSGASLR